MIPLDEDVPEEKESWPCEACAGTGYDKWGEVCRDCYGEGVVYDE